MDKSTHEIRLAQWKRIIEQCQHRPEGQSIKQRLADNQIKEKTYYYWQRKIRKDVIEHRTRQGTVLCLAKNARHKTVPCLVRLGGGLLSRVV